MSFNWMPASHDSYPGFDWIVVREGPFKNAETKKIQVDGRTVYVYIAGKIRTICGVYPIPERFSKDEVIFDRRTAESRLPYIMVNAHDAPATKKSKLHRIRLNYKKNHTVFQDSGGFQLYSGIKTFIHPADVAKAHRRYAHEGVGLDVPLGITRNPELALQSARVQYWNHKVIEQTFTGSTFVTSHGAYATERIAFLEETRRLYKDKIPYLCIAALRPVMGVFQPSLEALASHLAYVLHHVSAERVHILGVSGFKTFVLASMAAQIFKRKVTADSSRHIMVGAGGKMLTSDLRAISPRGSTGGGNLDERIRFNNVCACSICSRMTFDLAHTSTRFLQTHSFNSLTLSPTLATEIGNHYISSVPLPYIERMERALEVLSAPKSKSLENMKKYSMGKVKRTALFGDSMSPSEKTLASILATYHKFHKK